MITQLSYPEQLITQMEYTFKQTGCWISIISLPQVLIFGSELTADSERQLLATASSTRITAVIFLFQIQSMLVQDFYAQNEFRVFENKLAVTLAEDSINKCYE